MASDYGRNFGFRRSDESMRTSEGRFKTPVASALKLGSAVEIDPASAGYLKQSAGNATPVPGKSGLLVQEENFIRGTYDVDGYDTYDNGVALPDKLSVITFGSGTKVWYKNTGSETRADGRSISAVTIWVVGSVAVGDRLGWNGTQWIESDGSTTPHWFVVTSVDGSAGYVEAVLTF